MVEEVEINSDSVTFSNLEKTPIGIIGAFDRFGNKIEYSLSPYGLTTNGVIIKKLAYSYSPNNYDLSDTIGNFEKRVSAIVLAYGVVAEYCLVRGKFEEATMWHQRYVDGVDNVIKPKNATIKGRSFL